MHFNPVPGTANKPDLKKLRSQNPIVNLLVDAYGFDLNTANETVKEIERGHTKENMGAWAKMRHDQASKANKVQALQDNYWYSRGQSSPRSLDIGPVEVSPATQLDIGPAQVTPVEPAPRNNLEYLKQARDAQNERASAYKMLKEHIHVQDALNANDLAKGQLWGAIAPGMNKI